MANNEDVQFAGYAGAADANDWIGNNLDASETDLRRQADKGATGITDPLVYIQYVGAFLENAKEAQDELQRGG